MIFDGIDRRQERLAAARRCRAAGPVVAEHVALEPVERVVPLHHVPPAHSLPHSIDSVHASMSFPGPETRDPSPAYCRAVSSARFDGALRLAGVAESTATTT